jgi:hypothetical protein
MQFSDEEDFQKYIKHANKSFGSYSSSEVNAIKLLHKLRKSSASLGMKEGVMEWHFEVLRGQQIGRKPMVHQNTLLKK